ncbi:related to IES1 - Subunit 1 of the INO80 chromatin remodeling complex [Melanopsichium pennsylvanicum]|uniref:Related to IES1 - Subunit 1 of the INO80 chromatin remodeling complex n=2 Tax=Melanopsichium pennsylvanicum TaxID=63383 RepID=A0AAJ4XG71_9BASI|nr:related to IES1-Subunit 1 of the INO80 chromatin remodeling complex [Melanopsichium pennsylvanicum 4]SNX81909.1 related to IES1 - Subunit 1 of the INO80 chromatin remodeling complex [Melanopsichium pennsylvanicum]
MASTPPPDFDGKPTPSAPPALQIVRSNASNLPRNLPVKRYDGDPLGRVDVQHALLCHLFSDTQRVFTNPRPGDRSNAAASGSGSAGVPAPVYPYGMSAGCIRRSDESEEEFQQWKETRERFLRWNKRMKRKAKLERKAAAAAAAAEAGEDAAAADADGNANEEKDELAEGGTEGEADATKDDDSSDTEDQLDDSESLNEDEFPQPGAAKLTFKELYIESLLNSSKCTKSMRDKIIADEEYAEDFAKVCLLVNVGRINTTLAFYPEMKTVLRSYHPLPSMQNNENTRRNMQDAPRMKSLLKGVLIDTERPAPPTAGPSAGQPVKAQKPNALSEEAPSDFREVIKRFKAGTVPPTSVVTLIFLLSLHANEVTDMHFPTPHDSHSLFYPHVDHPLPSKQRAKAFLWLLYHYLEGPATQPPGVIDNPFEDESSQDAANEAAWAYNNMWTEEERKKRVNQPWKGVINPDWQKWKAAQENKDAAEERKEADKDGDVSMDGADGKVKQEGDAEEEVKEPPSHAYRLLVPALTAITPEEAAKENIDTEEEIRWGKQMQSERAAFLAKFQEEEAAKNATSAASPAPSVGTASGKGRRIGGASSTSAAANAERGSPSDTDGRKRKQAGAVGDVSKRSRMASPIDFDDSSSEPDAPNPTDPAAPISSSNPLTSDPYLNPQVSISDRIRLPLWDLDLSVPRQHQISESLPQLAWARILERAQRGVGDACYESDEDEFAEEEAQEPERSRAEVCKILTGLRGVVRGDVFDAGNHEVRVKYGGYEERREENEGCSRGSGFDGYNRHGGERERKGDRIDLYSSSTPVSAGRRGVYDQEEDSRRGKGDDVDDLEEALLGGEGDTRRRSVGRNGYTPVHA